MLKINDRCEVGFVGEPVPRLRSIQRLVHPRALQLVDRSIQDLHVVRIWLPNHHLCVVIRYIANATEGGVVAVVEKGRAVNNVECHSDQRHIDTERDPAPQRRGGAWEARQQGPQDLWLPLFVLYRLLHVELLQRAIVGAFDELGFGARVAFNRLSYDNVQLI